MAKKAELLEKAAELKLAVSEKNTIAEIEAAIAEAEAGTPESSKPHDTKDKDVIAAYARKLDYVSEGEKLVKITGLKPYEAPLYDTGTVVRREPIAFMSERTCKACGIAFFALTFVLLALTGESGEVMARRKKVQVLAEEKRISSAMRKTASDAAGKMRIASFGGGTR